MKALSIQQPWASLIIEGGKDIENRSWLTRYRGEFLVHASKKFDFDGYIFLRNNFHRLGFANADQIGDLLERLSPSVAKRGGIVGKVELVDCIAEHASPWKTEGQFGFVLRNPQPMEFIPMKGKLSFFDVQLPAGLGVNGNPNL